MDKRQSAVEWLESELKKLPFVNVLEVFENAKAMEKHQIREAYYTSLSSQYWHKGEQWLNDESEIYYTSTYGK